MLSIKYITGDLIQEPNLDWNSLPNKPIKYMDYKIGNQTIRLMGYEKYLRLKEMVQGVNVTLKGIGKIILIGYKGELCDKITLDLINKTCKKEELPFQEVYNGKEINNKFWKSGQLDNPNVYINHG